MFYNRCIRYPLSIVGIAIASLFTAMNGAAMESGLHGRVLGHDEKGEFVGVVAGAKITFESGSGRPAAETVTDQNGYYKIELPAGEFNFKIAANGYHTEQSGRGLRLTQGAGLAIANLSLTKGVDDPKQTKAPPTRKKLGKLRGRVVERTQLGFVGVSNARIALRREGAASLIFIETDSSRGGTQTSGSQTVGQYASELEAGKYSVSVIAPGFEILRDDQAIEIAVDQESKRDFTLIREVAESTSDEGIRGIVSIIDSDRTHPPIRLTLQSLSEGDHSTFDIPVANNGGFSQLLEPGCYRVTASAEGLPTVSSAPTFVLPGRFSLVNLTLRARAVPESRTTLEVFVFQKGERGVNEAPLSGVHVTVVRADAAEQTAIESTTDATGHARISLSHGGTYTATAFLAGYKSGSGTGHVDIGKIHELGIELVKVGSTTEDAYEIHISAVDATTQRPVVGAKILARQPTETLAESVRATTDAQGEATISVRKLGKYAVLAQHTGYLPKGDSAEVGLKGPNTLALLLEPILPGQVDQSHLTDPAIKKFNIRGYVAYREATGQLRSVSGTKIFWQRTIPTVPPASAFSVTGSDGRYQVDLQGGTYQVRVQPPAGFQAIHEEVQIDGDIGEKYFIVDRSDQSRPSNDLLHSLKGQVLTETSPGSFVPVTAADVQVFQTSAVERATTNARGEFGFRLPDGTYQLHVQARGYEPADVTTSLSTNTEPMRVVLKRINTVPADSNLTLTVVQQALVAAGHITTVAGANVQVSLDGRDVASGMTNRSGQFSMRVKPGTYVVSVKKLGFSTTVKNVIVAQANVFEQIALKPENIPSNTTNQAVLTVQVNQRGLRPSTNIRTVGVPLSGAQVVVLQGSQRIANGITNAAGSYRLPLPVGLYSVKVESQGFAPVGKTIQLTGANTQVDFLLSRIGSDTTNEEFPNLNLDPNRSIQNLDRNKFPGLLRDRTKSGGAVLYVVEYRLNPRSPWITLASKPSQQEANSALFLAIDRGRIPGTAQTRIRVESGIAR